MEMCEPFEIQIKEFTFRVVVDEVGTPHGISWHTESIWDHAGTVTDEDVEERLGMTEEEVERVLTEEIDMEFISWARGFPVTAKEIA